jgi:hypothetical protein
MKIEVENAQQNEQVDWTKNPQLVVSDDLIILTSVDQTSKWNDTCFCGMNPKNGNYDNGWDKKQFKPFYGKITLQND